MVRRIRNLAPTIVAVIIAVFLSNHVFTARAGNNNMYPVAAEVGRIAVYLDENAVQPGQDAILVTKNSNGSFTNQGSACPVSADEAARWLGVDIQDMTFTDTGFEKFWSYKAADGKPKSVRVPFGTFQDYKGTWTTWSVINSDAGTWRCAKAAQPNVKTETPVSAILPCPVFAGVQSYRLADGVNCKIDNLHKTVTDKVPSSWTVDFWDGNKTPPGVRTAQPGETISGDEFTFKPAK